MNWFFVALIAPILFSVSNYIDKFLLSRYFKKGAVVVDVGINRVDKKLYGDVNFENVFSNSSMSNLLTFSAFK